MPDPASYRLGAVHLPPYLRDSVPMDTVESAMLSRESTAIIGPRPPPVLGRRARESKVALGRLLREMERLHRDGFAKERHRRRVHVPQLSVVLDVEGINSRYPPSRGAPLPSPLGSPKDRPLPMLHRVQQTRKAEALVEALSEGIPAEELKKNAYLSSLMEVAQAQLAEDVADNHTTHMTPTNRMFQNAVSQWSEHVNRTVGREAYEALSAEEQRRLFVAYAAGAASARPPSAKSAVAGQASKASAPPPMDDVLPPSGVIIPPPPLPITKPGKVQSEARALLDARAEESERLKRAAIVRSAERHRRVSSATRHRIRPPSARVVHPPPW